MMEHALAAGGSVAPSCAPLDRHTLVWIAPWEQERMWALVRDEIRREALRRWFASDWPLIVRRAEGAVQAGHVALGLPLPPHEGKRRLCFEVADETIARFSPPLGLDEAAPRLPPAWRSPLAALARQARQRGVTLRVFGSVAWQALTSLDYLNAQSDVDLWWQPADLGQLDTMLAVITQWEQREGLRADGEIAFPTGAAVAWREWHESRSDERVLAKRVGGLELISRSALAVTLLANRKRHSR